VVDSDAGPEDQSRPPTLEDLLHLCRELNRAEAKYIVIGGMDLACHSQIVMMNRQVLPPRLMDSTNSTRTGFPTTVSYISFTQPREQWQ